MKKDRIVVFNRLTSKDSLGDVEAFETLVGSHYQKFRCLYDVISQCTFFRHIEDIQCKLGKGTDVVFKIKLNKEFNSSMESAILSAIEECEYIHGDDALNIKLKSNGDQISLSIKEA